MTQEKAIKMMKARLKCLECDTNGTSENCEECYLNYEQGMLGEQIEWMKVAIKTMEQEPIFDKIRAEIENMQIVYDKSANYKDERTDEEKANDLGKMYKVLVLSIIDKYKEEMESEE